MYAYRIQVFHAADDDAVVSAVADHFVLDFLPSCYRFFQQDLSDSTVLHAFIAKHLQLFHVFCDTAACAAQCICRTNDHRKAFFLDEVVAFFHRRCDDAARDRLADLLHQLLEFFPVFRLFDAFPVNAQKLCAVFFQNAFVIQLHSQIQTCLSSKSCQHAVRTFLVQDLFQCFFRQRFHIYFIRDSFISHDGGRVAVDQDRFDAFLPDRLAGLCSGIVKFCCLSDNDRT